MRTIWTGALALGAVLATNGFAVAQASDPARPKLDTGFTMTLGGTGTAAEAASADDTELTHWYRRYYRGYRSYYGGYGYGGWGYGGWGYSSFRYYSSFRPVYYRPYVYRPVYFRPAYYRPYYFPRAIPYVSYGRGYYWRIDADEDDLNTPVITLGSSVPSKPADVVYPIVPIVEQEGGLRYDGGPANPVPLPKPDASQPSPAQANGLPVSLQKTKPASPYTYKAYGEK